jgi:hypothetical protein
MPQSIEQRLVLHNRHSKPVDLWIEPWGDRVDIASDTSVHVLGIGPPEASFEIEFRDDGYAVYGWSGSIIKLLDESGHPIWTTTVSSP